MNVELLRNVNGNVTSDEMRNWMWLMMMMMTLHHYHYHCHCHCHWWCAQKRNVVGEGVGCVLTLSEVTDVVVERWHRYRFRYRHQ